jgi:hypothetical protein
MDIDFEKKASGTKKKVYEILRERREKENEEETEKNSKEDIEKDIEDIVNKVLKSKKNEIEVYSESTDDQTDSDEINLRIKEKKKERDVKKNKTPFCYIDYNIDNINVAKKNDYNTILIEKDKLTKELIEDIKNEKYFNFKNTYVVFNLWRTLTKSNLGTFSKDCTKYDHKKLNSKIETTIKWGSKQYLKESLNSQQQKNYSIFYEGVPELLKHLYHEGVKIFIVANCDYSFAKKLFSHFKVDKYIEEYFTPSKCGLPHGKLVSQTDSYKDNKKINKERVFVCIERYVGRMPVKS